jgi:hypothetical protein
LDPRYGEFRAKIQFTTAAWMPYQIYQACLRTGILSNTVYCQHAVCEALARDLDLDVNELKAALPRARTGAAHLFDPTGVVPGVEPRIPKSILVDHSGGIARYGMGNTDEEVY